MEALALAEEPGLHMKTYNPEYKYTFKWTFENFSKLPNGTIQRSSEFSVDPLSKWYVEFKKEDIHYFLHLCRNAETNAVLHCNISVLDCNKEILYNKKEKCNIGAKEWKYDLLPGKDRLVKIDKAPNDEVLFTILLEVRLPYKTVDMSDFSLTSDLQQKQLETLSRDFKNMRDNITGTDVTLRVRGDSMVVHKNVLCARSSVFASMFQQGMVENEDNVVHVEDISMSTMKALLSFMYSGLLVDYDFDTALEVYYAADKYSVMDLRDICGRVLVSKLTLDSASSVLYLADKHRDVVLRDKVMQYILYPHKQCKNEKNKDS